MPFLARRLTVEAMNPSPVVARSARLIAAESTALLGASTSWDGYGTKPLGVCPDKVLKAARRWFGEKLKEQRARPDIRFQAQIAAITIILEHREANSPQQSLAL